MDYSCRKEIILTTLLVSMVYTVRAQINTPCTGSMISTFTPCLNYVTGSTDDGGSPTEECCNSFKKLVTDSMECTCLIVTGNVPVSIPFVNRNLAISLPRICKSSVPIQCKASGDPLPAPGPVLFGPPPPHTSIAAPPPSHAHSPKASKAAIVAAPPPAVETLGFSPVSSPQSSLGPSANPRIRPVFIPESASAQSSVSLWFLVLILIGIMTFNI